MRDSVTERRGPIHIAAYTDATDFGGAERCLATLLARLDPGFRVTVVGTDAAIVQRIASARAGAATAVAPRVRTKRDAATILGHVRLLRRLRPDVCHVNLRTPYAAQYGLLAALLAPGTRVVAVEHLPYPTKSPLSRWLKRRTSRWLDAHVAVGDRAARLVEEEAGLPRGSIEVIRNGVPAHEASGLVERLGNGPVVGSVGRLDSQKGFDVLVDALALLPEATAVVVGDGPERAALERRARDLGAARRFIVTGWRDDVEPLLRGFDLFVLPSRFEGLPLAILEAMAAGLAVVATDVGSVAEAVADGETGLLVAPNDPAALAAAVQRLLEDEQTRRLLGARAYQVWSERFDAAAMAREYERLYRRLAP